MTPNIQTRDRAVRGLSGAVVSATGWACREQSESGVALRLTWVSMLFEAGGGGCLARTCGSPAV